MPPARSMPQTRRPLTATQIAELALGAGFGKDDSAEAVTAVAKALAESGGRYWVRGGPNKNGTYDYGLWQINGVHGYDEKRLLNDPAYNARAAYEVFQRQGFDAWYAHPSGTQRQQAARGVRAALGGEFPNSPAGMGGNWATKIDDAASNLFNIDSIVAAVWPVLLSTAATALGLGLIGFGIVKLAGSSGAGELVKSSALPVGQIAKAAGR